MKINIYKIKKERINNKTYITHRVQQCPVFYQESLETVLRYIYGKRHTCPKSAVRKAEGHLEAAEVYLANWLTNKSNDTKGKMHYGENAVRASKNAKYMCKICGQSDVRTLEIDHKDGHRANKGLKNLICLCGNCHNIKTRQSGLEKRLKEKVIKLGADSRKKNVPNYIENEYVAIKNLLKSLYS